MPLVYLNLIIVPETYSRIPELQAEMWLSTIRHEPYVNLNLQTHILQQIWNVSEEIVVNSPSYTWRKKLGF
jgi:hypothetical protein